MDNYIFNKDMLIGSIIILALIVVFMIIKFYDCNISSNQEQFMPAIEGFPFSILIINMDKNPERYAYVTGQLDQLNIKNYERFPAIEGAKMTQKEIEELHLHNFVGNNGMMGCAASHIKIWEKIANENRDWTLILEDDVLFHPQFLYLFKIFWQAVPSDAMIIYPGYCRGSESLYDYNQLILETGVFCTHSYLINSEGARYLLDNISSMNHISPVYTAIDAMIYFYFKWAKINSPQNYKKCYIFNGYANINGIIPNDYRIINKDAGALGIIYQNNGQFKSTINKE